MQIRKRPFKPLGHGDFGQSGLSVTSAVVAQKVDARQDGVGNRDIQRYMPVTFAIDAARQNVGVQRLDHPDLARPDDGGVQRELNSGLQRDGGKDLRPEHPGPAAILGKGRKGVAGLEIALGLAEVGLEGPEGK